MGIFKWLLLPFSLIYAIITDVRNFLYNRGAFKSYSFKTTTICVGNLSVGGTGKSPMIEHLIEIYKDDFNIAVLSRGYKRKTKGCIEVKTDMTPLQVGDEPLQFKRKFKSVKIFVDADRKNGIEQIEKKYPETELILLDDAYQHRRVKADINILLTTFAKPFYKDFILPVGRLRETTKGKTRAKVIMVTKCPDELSEDKIESIKRGINANENQDVLFSKIAYDEKIYNETETLDLKDFDNFCLVTGIANPKPLIQHLNNHNKTFEHQNFPDHHNFTTKEIESLKSLNKPILTTEKDYTRLYQSIQDKMYFLPIKVDINKDVKTILNI